MTRPSTAGFQPRQRLSWVKVREGASEPATAQATGGTPYENHLSLQTFVADTVGSYASDLVRDLLLDHVRVHPFGRSVLVAGARGAGKTTAITRGMAGAMAQIEGAIAEGSSPQRRVIVPVQLSAPDILRRAEAPGAHTGLSRALVEVASAALHTALESTLADAFALLYRQPRRPFQASGVDYAAHLRLLGRERVPTLPAYVELWRMAGCLETGVLAESGTAFNRRGILEAEALHAAWRLAARLNTQITDDIELTADASRRTEQAAAWVGKVENAAPLLLSGLPALVGAWQRDLAWLAAVPVALALQWTFTSSRARRHGDGQIRTQKHAMPKDVSLHDDLPGVLDRAQAAGLHPVFILDEIDKLAEWGPEGTTDRTPDFWRQLRQEKAALTERTVFIATCSQRQFAALQSQDPGGDSALRSLFSDSVVVGFEPVATIQWAARALGGGGA